MGTVRKDFYAQTVRAGDPFGYTHACMVFDFCLHACDGSLARAWANVQRLFVTRPLGVGVGELETPTNGGVIYLSQFNAILPAILSSTTWWCVCVCVYESNVAQ